MTPLSRINYLDGLRGVLAIIVFIHHFLYSFYSELVFGGSYHDYLTKNPYTLKRLIALSPVNILFNPAMAVMFFFILSGYVQTRAYFKTNNFIFLQLSFVKRYFRLAIPTLTVVMLVFLFHKLHLFHKDYFPEKQLSSKWLQALMPDNLGFFGAFYHGLFDCFVGDRGYYQVLWTIPVELSNSYLVLFLSMATHNFGQKRRLFALVLFIQLFMLHSYNGAAFTLGMLLASYDENTLVVGIGSRPAIKIICWIIGIYFASYPYTAYEGSAAKSVYSPISFFDRYAHLISYLIGVSFMFFALLYSGRIQKMLSGRLLLFFGEISFMLYLVHFLILMSFSPWLYHHLKFASFGINLTITFLTSFALITIVSYVLYRLVDKPTVNLCNSYSRRLFHS